MSKCAQIFFTKILFFLDCASSIVCVVGAAHYHFVSYVPVIEFLMDVLRAIRIMILLSKFIFGFSISRITYGFRLLEKQ